MYVETGTGRKIALLDMKEFVISISTRDGKQVAQFTTAEFKNAKAISTVYNELLDEYGALLTFGKITEITADMFNVHPSYVRKIIHRRVQKPSTKE
jgi:hypothetical protein